MDEAMTPDLEVDNTQAPEAQEQTTNEAEVGLIAAYERETGNDLDRSIPGVDELVSEYGNSPSIPQEVIVRQLINLTTKPESEEPEVQIEQSVAEVPTVENTEEIPQPE